MNGYSIRSTKIWMCMVFMLRDCMNRDGFKLQSSPYTYKNVAELNQ